MFLSALRQPVDTLAPSVGRLYRRMRDFVVARQSRQTIYGFKLAGDARMASSDFEPDEVKAFLELIESHDMVFGHRREHRLLFVLGRQPPKACRLV